MAPKDKKKGTAMQAAGSVAVAKQYDYGEDDGAGFEAMTHEDFRIPFLVILQPLSPQVDEDHASYITGAKPGMICNTVTLDVFDKDEGVVIVPCHRTHHFIEWVPRDSGGGLVQVYDTGDEFVVTARDGASKFGKIDLPNGNELIETFGMFGILVSEDTRQQVMMAFSSTQIKAYKTWMTRVSSLLVKKEDGREVVPPLFAHRHRLTTRKFTNDKGTWYGWNVAYDGANAVDARIDPASRLYQDARDFRSSAKEFASDTIGRSINQEPAGEETPKGSM